MGGDHGATVVVPGAELSLRRHPDAEYLLFGDGAVIEPLLAARPPLKAATPVHAHRCCGRDGRQAEPGAAPGPLEELDVARHRRGQARRRRRRHLGRQYRRADGDGEIPSQDHAGNRSSGHRGALADRARRIDRARSRRQHRGRRGPSRRSGGDGQRHGAGAVGARAAHGGLAQYRGRGGQRPRRGAGGGPHPARSARCRSSITSASSRATPSDRAWWMWW